MTRLPAAEIRTWLDIHMLHVRLLYHPTDLELKVICHHLAELVREDQFRQVVNLVAVTPQLRDPQRYVLMDLLVNLSLRGGGLRTALVTNRPAIAVWSAAYPRRSELFCVEWAEFTTTPPAVLWLRGPAFDTTPWLLAPPADTV